MWQQDNRYKGAITVEAAIVLPVFICVAISLAMLIKLIYIHDVIQHSIDEAANELAAYSYIYQVSGLRQVDESLQSELDENSELAESHYTTVLNAYDTLQKTNTYIGNSTKDINNAVDSEDDFIEKAGRIFDESSNLLSEGQRLSSQSIDNINQLYDLFEEVSMNPGKEAESIAWMISKSIYGDIKTIIAVPIVKHTVKKHLGDERLKKLNIYKGFEGLDFYSSTFFNSNENIDIVVKYKVQLPLPIKLLPDIFIVQRSTARAWLNGGDGLVLQRTSIWDLPNKERGMKIEELYGGNLPYDFPLIDIYNAATLTGTSIKSINLNNKTYQDKQSLRNVLKKYVNDISSCNTIKYDKKNYDISIKKLIIVIPKGSINETNNNVLEEIKSYAAASGIYITISEL